MIRNPDERPPGGDIITVGKWCRLTRPHPYTSNIRTACYMYSMCMVLYIQSTE